MPREKWHTSTARLWRKLKPHARRMRREPTEAEQSLWTALRNGALGVRFRRQHAIDRFIVDFCCLAGKLIVEVDGEIHRANVDRDNNRADFLEQRGYRILRFSNRQVVEDIDNVLEAIRRALNKQN